MRLEPIIQSLLDTDLYKFTMDQAFFLRNTDLEGKYYFTCRNKDVVFTKEMYNEICEQVDYLCGLTFTQDELDYLRTIRFLRRDYIEFLRLWHPIREYVDIQWHDGKLDIVVDGPLFSAMFFEIYLLEIISEVYFRMNYIYDVLIEGARVRLDANIKAFQDETYTFKFSEFGGRRRFSREWQDEVVRRFATETNAMVGTSNVYLAKKYNLMPTGTSAHEYTMAMLGYEKIPLAYANYYALKEWYDVYRGDNGIALTDTLGTDVFLLDFDRSMASTFTGCRNDSGNPFEWANKLIAHYKKYNIDPHTKTLLFSNSLSLDEAQNLYNAYKDRVNVAFGIGGGVTTCGTVPGLNIVIKLQYVNGRPVAKLSDDAGKTMCQDSSYVEYLKNAVKFRLENERK